MFGREMSASNNDLGLLRNYVEDNNDEKRKQKDKRIPSRPLQEEINQAQLSRQPISTG